MRIKSTTASRQEEPGDHAGPPDPLPFLGPHRERRCAREIPRRHTSRNRTSHQWGACRGADGSVHRPPRDTLNPGCFHSRPMDLPLGAAPPFLATPTLDEPFVVLMPSRQTAPIVFASPHSGRTYPEAFLAESRLDPITIRRSEDSFVEELFGAAPLAGCPLIHALFPRAWCDVNREPWELDPAMFDTPLPDFVNAASPRVGAGLGTIARVVATGEAIYRRKLRFAEAESRIAGCWRPYHVALAGLIADPERRVSMGEAGRKRARTLFSPSAVTHAHEALYESLLSGRSA